MDIPKEEGGSLLLTTKEILTIFLGRGTVRVSPR